MSTKPVVLIADDQVDVLAALELLLEREGFTVLKTTSPNGVKKSLEARGVDVALIDLNYTRDTTSGKEGLDLLSWIKNEAPELPVVVMTAWGSVEGAVGAIQRGARDYVQKPWENARLVATLKTQLELSRALIAEKKLTAENERLRDDATAPNALIADSPAMRSLMILLERVAPSDANILITGEHGTGKEMVARAVQLRSARAEKPFVTINAGGLAEGVFESELFGHVRGAFTDAKSDRVGCFELADQGTLFLDEIGNMPLQQQAKLLRVLQTGELHPVGSSRVKKVDVRVLAATNSDLHKERFREDLLYRLNTVELHVPPLRERTEDIEQLAMVFLERAAIRYRRRVLSFSPEAMAALETYAWPGNVRELEHAMERAVLVAAGEVVRVEELALRGRGSPPAALENMTLEEAERHLIQRALKKAEGNVSEAAKLLGLSRSALYRRLHHYGLKV